MWAVTRQFTAAISQILHTHSQTLGIHSRIRSIRVSRLGLGENNESFKITVNGRYKYTLRAVLTGKRRSQQNHTAARMRQEFEMLHIQHEQHILPSKICPRPLLFDDTHKLMPRTYCMLQFVPGKVRRHWTDEQVDLHAHTLARLHEKTYPYFGEGPVKLKTFDLLKHYQKWLSGFRFKKSQQDLRDTIVAHIRQSNYLFTSLREFSLIHGDLCNENIIFNVDHAGEKHVTYIDWEWFHIGDPARDIACTLCMGHRLSPGYSILSPRQQARFIKVYVRARRWPPEKIADFLRRLDVWIAIIAFNDFLYFRDSKKK